MRIAVLTGGGDVPGLNSCIKAITNDALAEGWEVIGLRRGWAGLLQLNPDDPDSRETYLTPLDERTVKDIDRTGGTILHTSRTNPSNVAGKDLPAFLQDRYKGDGPHDCTDHALSVIESLGIDTIFAIGGDDTLSYAARLHQEGINVMACPKTMDNDVFGTDYCIGFGTAVSRSVDFIDALRTPAASHERIAVIELFGRNSGETALISGYLAGADRVLISEVPVNTHHLAELVTVDQSDNPLGYAVVVVSEGARMEDGDIVESGEADPYGHRKLGGVGQQIGERLKALTGKSIINQSLAYLMRAGPPVALDRIVASAFGTMAVQLRASGETGLMMAIRDGNYETVPVGTCITGQKRVDVPELYDTETYRPRIRRVRGKPMFLY